MDRIMISQFPTPILIVTVLGLMMNLIRYQMVLAQKRPLSEPAHMMSEQIQLISLGNKKGEIEEDNG